MGFCYNCGTPVGNNDIFCAACGARLEQEEAVYEQKSDTSGTIKKGYIFTNIEALAHKFNAGRGWLEKQLQVFIEKKKVFGVSYSLIDVSDYEPRLSINKQKKIKISPSESWIIHQRVLADRYVYDTEHRKEDVEYLFIIGGNDIIPMPTVVNYLPQYDPTIDTDLPYGYLYGQQTQQLLESGALFHHPAMLHVGRLPFATDAISEDLSRYLERDLWVSEYGIPVSELIYGQCDPHWKKVSGQVIDELIPAENQIPDEYKDHIYRGLVLTPHVTSENIHHFFNEKASIYYFNMHGSNFPTSAAFVGIGYPPADYSFPGISPVEIKRIASPNIVMTEACYGARFIKAGVNDSMLLSAMRNQTVLYVGSSRIAIGAVDQREGRCSPSNADIIARYFILGLLSGYDAALSLYIARSATLEGNPEGLTSFLTVTEFNLFGDPTLTFTGYAGNGKKTDVSPKFSHSLKISPTLIRQEEYAYTEIRKIDTSGEGTILDKVRGAVNFSINDIHSKINNHLYSQYGIRPRKLDSVFEVDNKYGRSLLYIYEQDEHSQIWVILDENKQIKKVLTTK